MVSPNVNNPTVIDTKGRVVDETPDKELKRMIVRMA
jgi:hypothetical protein